MRAVQCNCHQIIVMPGVRIQPMVLISDAIKIPHIACYSWPLLYPLRHTVKSTHRPCCVTRLINYIRLYWIVRETATRNYYTRYIWLCAWNSSPFKKYKWAIYYWIYYRKKCYSMTLRWCINCQPHVIAIVVVDQSHFFNIKVTCYCLQKHIKLSA